MALLKRTADQVLRDAMEKIKNNTPITNFKPGAIARALVEAMKDEFPSLYDYAEEVLNMGFLSKAVDQYLDMIGQLFSYPRRIQTIYDEKTGLITQQLIDDKTYRYEISQRVLTAANANYQALRLAALAVPGVDDVVGMEFTHGTGSFSFMIVPSFGFTPADVKANVFKVFQDIKAYGVKRNVMLPREIPMELQVQLVFHESTTASDRDRIRFDCKSALYTYFANFNMGQGFIYNDLVQQIMDADKNILDFTITRFYLNNQPVLLTNQAILNDEMIVAKVIDIL
ncbi:hypothetical protein GZH47_32650 (plasmid) [Paenibacillus rhizovicinus]|uniref:Baseplate protein J-like domain-containing protein n=1 Tax=Paenibacillus rhizovicinus TaxID=2704463 RepID=A0A6C0PAP1_9BACL|nr:hypothetical protein [Paenibacillus rhizovicinus]QHW35650.1 hypothetical protein GZH47_32650 [Paenibacillus rhizovicinus]